MCGIAGIIATDGVRPDALERMGQALLHRGPDATGYLLHEHGHLLTPGPVLRDLQALGRRPAVVGLAHRRLSIIDLTTASDQPMVDASGRRALVYNGELYNYVELRDDLERLGHAFRTSGDTEVILAAYTQWGPECVVRFVGMWAFALLDSDRRQLLLSRDRFGIKPLFYAASARSLHFASEIKALLAGGLSVEPDEDVVRAFLLTGRADAGESTFFRGIFRLPAGHNAVVSLDSPGDVRPRRYWTPPAESYRGSVAEAAEEFAALLADAVRLHARADVPVGTCLSGGLDSSAIVCMAEELRSRGEVPRYTHTAFGYVPNDPALSERRHMDSVSRPLSLSMTYVTASDERTLAVIPAVARQQDEPFGTASIVAQWLVFEAAREAGLKVMLDGQGADEVLGGYHSYLPMVARTHLRSWRFARYLRFASEHRQRHGRPPLPVRDAVASTVPSLRRLAQGRVGAPPPATELMSERMRAGWRDSEDGVLQPRTVHDILERALTRQLQALLRFEDRNSMAHSIEARVPFLDHRLVEFAFRLPGDYKIRGVETKHILRQGLAGIVPDAILQRTDKVGFRPDPGITWRFASRHRDELLANGTDFEERWLDRSAVARLLGGAGGSSEREFLAWRVISTKLWLRDHWSDRPFV